LAPAASDIDAVTVAVPVGLSAVIEWFPADNVSGPTIVLAAAAVATDLPSTEIVMGVSATPWTT
jgi:hypothetical protein